jgi:hypothetical protein
VGVEAARGRMVLTADTDLAVDPFSDKIVSSA